jgi:hypothetical protein
MPRIARRHFQGAQHGNRGQSETRFHHCRIHIAPTRNAAAKTAVKGIITLNPAGDVMALHQPRQHRRRRRTAITPRAFSAAGLPACRGGNAGKPDDPIPKTKRFAIKDADL